MKKVQLQLVCLCNPNLQSALPPTQWYPVACPTASPGNGPDERCSTFYIFFHVIRRIEPAARAWIGSPVSRISSSAASSTPAALNRALSISVISSCVIDTGHGGLETEAEILGMCLRQWLPRCSNDSVLSAVLRTTPPNLFTQVPAQADRQDEGLDIQCFLDTWTSSRVAPITCSREIP